jgi:hypothetical protein
MKELRLLPRSYLVGSEIRLATDVVMRAKEDDAVRIFEKPAKRIDLLRARVLQGPHRVEADDDERIDRREQRPSERLLRAVVEDALELADGISRLRAHERREPGKVRLLHVIEKAADTLVDLARIGERALI